MRTVLLTAALALCVLSAAAFAADPAPSGDRSGKTAPGAGIKAFIHPETGEVLTPEQWQALGIESGEPGSGPLSSSGAPKTENAPAVLQGRQIDLGDGDYVIIVDAPESGMVKTRAWFDEEGKVHIRCSH